MAVLALMGSGEFLPWAREVDLWCVERARVPGDRVLVIPTACAEEGAASWDRWATMGVEHYGALDLQPEVLELRTRDDATKPAVVDAVAGARLLFFSGGNPGYLAQAVAGTPFWEAVKAAVAEGTALGGCSAGAVFTGVRAPFVENEQLSHWVDGTRLLARAFVLPHYDMLDTYEPGITARWLALTPPGARAVCVDEETALCGDGERWTVFGRGEVRIAPEGAPHEGRVARDGETLEAPLGLDI